MDDSWQLNIAERCLQQFFAAAVASLPIRDAREWTIPGCLQQFFAAAVASLPIRDGSAKKLRNLQPNQHRAQGILGKPCLKKFTPNPRKT